MISKTACHIAAAAVLLAVPIAAPSVARADVLTSGISGTLCMDVNTSTNKVILYSCHFGSNQNFFAISSYGPQRMGNLCLQGTGAGADLFMAPCNNGRDQKWLLTSSGEYKNEGGWCADVPNGDARASQRVISYTCNGGKNQTWFEGRKVAAPSAAAASAPPGTIFSSAGQIIGRVSSQGNIISGGAGNIISGGAGNFIGGVGGAIISGGAGN